MHQPRYSKEEHARRGTDLYNNRIKELVADQAHGQIVAIYVDSGEYLVADNTHAAATSLLSRLPDPQVWCVRIGHEAVRKY